MTRRAAVRGVRARRRSEGIPRAGVKASAIENRSAVDAGWIRLSHGEMEEQIVATARKLKTLGVRRGDTVALLATNSIDWILLARAIARVGAILMPVNTRLAPDEIEGQLEQAGASLLLYEDRFTIPEHPILAITPEDLRAIPDSGEGIPRSIPPDRPYSVLFTSGTSGRAKGVVLTRANAIASAAASSSILDLVPEDRWLLCLPLFHVGGLSILTRCALRGACVVLHERFDPAAVNDAIDHGKATLVSVVGAMLRRILDDRGGRPFPPTLRAIVVGGGPVDRDLIASCPQALSTYGLTETGSMVTLVPPDATPEERQSAGRPLPGIAIRILGEAGAPVAAGREGAIAVRGPVVMAGYLGEKPLRRGGWFRTGDMGRLDRAGCLHIVGRRTDLIVSGGENVYPAEIEAVLAEVPGVAEAVVVGVPDSEWGEIPMALIVARESALSVADITHFLERRLARYKIPAIRMSERIPCLSNGKPDRVAIASLLHR
jgi:o-succinylbenzoate---CoA ligase